MIQRTCQLRLPLTNPWVSNAFLRYHKPPPLSRATPPLFTPSIARDIYE